MCRPPETPPERGVLGWGCRAALCARCCSLGTGTGASGKFLLFSELAGKPHALCIGPRLARLDVKDGSALALARAARRAVSDEAWDGVRGRCCRAAAPLPRGARAGAASPMGTLAGAPLAVRGWVPPACSAVGSGTEGQ